MVDGVCEPDIQQLDDMRSVSISMKLTSGLRVAREFTIPAIIYKEIYRDGVEYCRGDAVTWGGSVWHCQSETTKAKPGEGSADWKLMVKRGAAGKDGNPPALPPNGGPVKL